MKTIVISLGGSVIVPDKINVGFLIGFKKLILRYIKKGYRFVIITGGGKVAREYKEYACKISDIAEIDKHFIGITATRLNAELIRSIFGEWAYVKVLLDYNHKINTNKKIIVAAGFKPGTTTDFESVKWAQNFNVNNIINISNIDHVYDKDPRKSPDAIKIENISWEAFRKIIGKDNRGGGKHFPFDPFASKLAQEGKIKVSLTNCDLKNIEDCILGKRFVGTVIG
jgi:uridylate kinase